MDEDLLLEKTSEKSESMDSTGKSNTISMKNMNGTADAMALSSLRSNMPFCGVAGCKQTLVAVIHSNEHIRTGYLLKKKSAMHQTVK